VVRALGKAGRRWLLLGHRWLGIVTGLFLALWIGSGLVMLYVPFPSLGRAEKLERLVPLAWDRVRIGPDAALAAAGRSGVPTAFGLEMRGKEPVYRIAAADGARTTISATTGLRLGPVGPDEARAMVGGRDSEEVRRDQWTVTARYDPLRPFHKVALGNAAGTEVYVSAPTGEVALVTTRWQRGWNWVGAVTHWVYLTPLRAEPETWRQVVLWLSGIASLTAVSGVVIGIWRLRLRRRTRSGAVSPYRGLALWHHAFGLLGGVGLVTFILSGWLSMNPNRWFSSLTPPEVLRAAYAGMPGPLDLAPERLWDLGGAGLKQLRFAAIGGRWWIVRETAGGPVTLALDGGPGPDEAILTAAASGPDGRLASVERLTAYDSYWYPKGGEASLPVLRFTFDDPASTWLHIDPRDGALLNRLDRSGRLNRWLFDAPHRLDLPGLTLRPAAREAMQWALNLLGPGIALTGLVAGGRRLARLSRRRPIRP
jgi:hypothetical protein